MKSKNDYYSRHQRKAAEEAAKKASEEEAEKERLAQAAEEARLAALAKLAEEEERMKKANQKISLVTEEDKRKDIIAWLNSVPLSESCFKRVDRAFSSGVLVAELINYFCPWICDKRHYFKWTSSINKLSNWDNLNYKVFPKLGFRLHQRQVCNILNPYSCGKFQQDCEKGLFIFKLLSRIRDKLADMNPSVYDYRSPSFVPPASCNEKKQRKVKREFRNMRDHPCYSKIEILIANGYYDDKDKEKEAKKETETTASSPEIPSPCFSMGMGCMCSNMNDNNKPPITMSLYTMGNSCYTYEQANRAGTEIFIPTTFNCSALQHTRCFLY